MTANSKDSLLIEVADYVCAENSHSKLAYETARHCLLDSIACGLMALEFPACTKLLGPVVPGAEMQNGVRVFGTDYRLDPVTAAFNIGAMVRWLDFNDTWLAAEWGHPSDNLGAILACADYQSRVQGGSLTVGDVLDAMIVAHEIQGVLALDNSFNRVGLDHVLLVRVASAAVATKLLGGTRNQVIAALSHAWLDGGALRTYRHAPNTGSRKSWAAGDATSRAVRIALMVLKGESGYATPLSADKWGFQDVLFGGKPITISRSLGCYVMENILFKISFPAEFHAQTAVEAAIQLCPSVSDRLEEIERIEIETQEPGVRIIDKRGPLKNPADRDHCLQYMTAIGLIFGELTAGHYEGSIAADPRIDQLRDKMTVTENESFTRDYYDAELRSIPNSVQVHFTDGTTTDRTEVHFPVGHRRRREEGIPLLMQKFRDTLQQHFGATGANEIYSLVTNADKFVATPVTDFCDALSSS